MALVGHLPPGYCGAADQPPPPARAVTLALTGLPPRCLGPRVRVLTEHLPAR
jgi:hypothetical protein